MRVIFVGRLVFGKGVQDLLKVSRQLWTEGQTFDLAIVGDGDYRKQLEAMADHRAVTFTGMLARADVMRELAHSDIFVNPSYTEGLPTSVMEAASVGLPIIATDVGGTREIITDGYSGLLYRAGDVTALAVYLQRLLDSPSLAKLMGERAKAGLDKFDWRKITQQYDAALKEVTKK